MTLQDVKQTAPECNLGEVQLICGTVDDCYLKTVSWTEVHLHLEDGQPSILCYRAFETQGQWVTDD